MRQALLVAGLGYGDEGKGSIVDYLARKHEAKLVVRYNGGAQAAHSVVLPDGTHHTFSQYGSGALAGAKTFLSRHMLVNPLTLIPELLHLKEIGGNWQKLAIDRRALVTNRYQMAANRLRELARGADCHGSCGMGIGETVADALEAPDEAIVMDDLTNTVRLERKLSASLRRKREQLGDLLLRRDWGRRSVSADEARWILTAGDPREDADEYFNVGRQFGLVGDDYLPEQLKADGTVIFEGAQGVLLDQDHGFHPHTTWSDCTFHNALDLLDGYDGPIVKIGVTRTYATRHGAGPLVTEDKSLCYPEPHNGDGFQGAFRQGHLDFVALRYAVTLLGGIDQVALTHVDRVDPVPACWTYYERDKQYGLYRAADPWPDDRPLTTEILSRMLPEYGGKWMHEELLSRLAKLLGAPVAIISRGPTWKDKVER
jgi:adenylosuccinate synthase